MPLRKRKRTKTAPRPLPLPKQEEVIVEPKTVPQPPEPEPEKVIDKPSALGPTEVLPEATAKEIPVKETAIPVQAPSGLPDLSDTLDKLPVPETLRKRASDLISELEKGAGTLEAALGFLTMLVKLAQGIGVASAFLPSRSAIPTVALDGLNAINWLRDVIKALAEQDPPAIEKLERAAELTTPGATPPGN